MGKKSKRMKRKEAMDAVRAANADKMPKKETTPIKTKLVDEKIESDEGIDSPGSAESLLVDLEGLEPDK